eukprot:PITA_18656
MTLQPFKKWGINFVGPIKAQGKTGARYIVTAMEYFTRWKEAKSVKDYIGVTAAKFLFEHVYHQKSTCYHPQTNGAVEVFNEVLENALNKVYNSQRSDWDLRIPVVLWAYQTTYKKLIGQTPFRLVYGVEAIIPMEYIVPSLRIATLIGMTDRRALEERLSQLDEIEEE